MTAPEPSKTRTNWTDLVQPTTAAQDAADGYDRATHTYIYGRGRTTPRKEHSRHGHPARDGLYLASRTPDGYIEVGGPVLDVRWHDGIEVLTATPAGGRWERLGPYFDEPDPKLKLSKEHFRRDLILVDADDRVNG